MAKVKTIKIYPSERIPALQQGTDRVTVPFRWLASLVEDLKRAIPESEQKTCMVHGVDQLYATYEHVLSPEEEAKERMETVVSAVKELDKFLPTEGPATLSADQVETLKHLLSKL